jgi:exosome complex component RRP42
MGTEVVSELMRSHIHRLAAAGKRMDGRGPEEFRPLVVEKGWVKTAEGSARVHLGNTDVLVGVKVELGEPFRDTPNTGVLTTNAELIPMASPTFEPGPPSPHAIELARVVDRGIRETKTIDFEKLCIKPGEQVWVVFVDIHVLDYDGNLFDAANFAALAALTTAMVPGSKLGEEDRPLQVQHYPISVTTAKIKDSLLVDPALDEERIADARITITTDENGDVRAMQKGLRGAFTLDEVKRLIRVSQRLGVEIRGKIKE